MRTTPLRKATAEKYQVGQQLLMPVGPMRPEEFELDSRRKRIVRHVRLGTRTAQSAVGLLPGRLNREDLGGSFDACWLRSATLPPALVTARDRVRIVDLFSGCGGLSLGISEAARALGLETEHVLAVDLDPDALHIFKANAPEADVRQTSVAELFPGEFGERLLPVERELAKKLGSIDFLVGGPPCQGHSDLNNHTRRDDPRNSLYLRMARCAEALRPRHVVIENVPGVVHDANGVVQQTTKALESLGYKVQSGVLSALNVGVPQARKRFVLVASRAQGIEFERVSVDYRTSARPFAWACDDLVEVNEESVFDSAANHSETNQARINFLFDHDLYDLPDEQRPDCHRLKPHSYRAVYGRLRWDEPVPTITRGFGSTGQGRFVHPRRRRSLTPHEAARLQFFPDYFSFAGVRRYALQIIIGNAVPSKLSYVVGLELLRRELNG